MKVSSVRKSVEEDVAAALAFVAKEFATDFELMDEVLAYVQGLLTKGDLKYTNQPELNNGVVYLAASILTKGCKTFRAIKATALAGCGQDASILLRALFESTVALLYILQKDCIKRAALYGAHEGQRSLVRLEALRGSVSEAALEKARANVDQWTHLLSTAEINSVRRHWSGLPGGLEAAANELGDGWPQVYASMYRHLSAFSHGSDSSAHIHVSKGTTTPVLNLLPGPDELDRVLPMACSHLLAMASGFGQRLGLGIENEIKTLDDRSIALAKSWATKRGEVQPSTGE